MTAPIAEMASTSIDLVNCKPLKFQNQFWRKLRVSRFPLIRIVQYGVRLNSAVPTFQLEFLFGCTI